MTPQTGRMVTPGEVAERLRNESRLLAVSHEAPDGDALGCISAMLLMAKKLGIQATGYVPGTSALPDEYGFLPGLTGISRGGPPKVEAGTTMYILDCGSPSRSNGLVVPAGAHRVNIDHHQDNPGYGDFNYLEPKAPSTTAMVYDIFKAGGFDIDPGIATSLYVGLVTDTGRFQYSNTTPAAHRMAAELQEAGVDVNEVYRLIYEGTPLPKLLLLQRALCHLDVRLAGALVVSWLGKEDFGLAGAEEGHAEGIIDTLRRIQGVRVAAVVKQRSDDHAVDCKVSLRSTDGTVNVAAIAKKRGGGGHVRAAGFSCSDTPRVIIDWIEQEVASSL